MKFILSLFASLVIGAAAPALAQVSGGPGPGPTPNPWTVNGSQIYYSNGCVSVSATPPGACNGAGSLTADELFATTITADEMISLEVRTDDLYIGGSLITGIVESVDFGSTGLTPATPTTGDVVVSGTLVVGNGGTGAATFTANGLLFGNGTSPFGVTAAGTTGQYLRGNTGNPPEWGTLASDAVTSINFGTTGLTPNSGTAGAVSVAGTLVVANGGTGATSLTGILLGNGTSAFTVATAGTDYVAPGVATNFTAKQTFTGTSSTIATSLVSAVEPATIAASAAGSTIAYDVCSQSIVYYTVDATGDWTINLRCSSGTSLDTVMAVGDVVTVTFLATQGATPYYNNIVQVDGTPVTPLCQGGLCPTVGNANGVDAYTYAIIKTGSATFTVLTSQVPFG